MPPLPPGRSRLRGEALSISSSLPPAASRSGVGCCDLRAFVYHSGVLSTLINWKATCDGHGPLCGVQGILQPSAFSHWCCYGNGLSVGRLSEAALRVFRPEWTASLECLLRASAPFQSSTVTCLAAWPIASTAIRLSRPQLTQARARVPGTSSFEHQGSHFRLYATSCGLLLHPSSFHSGPRLAASVHLPAALLDLHWPQFWPKPACAKPTACVLRL